jgi:hypothetical protein
MLRNPDRPYRTYERPTRPSALRRALAGVGGTAALWFALTRTPVGQPVALLGDVLSGQTNKPDATEAYVNGQAEIHLQTVASDDGTQTTWPMLRKNPEVHNHSNGLPPNDISWQDVTEIDGTKVNLQDRSIVIIQNPTLVEGGNPDDYRKNAPRGTWAVLRLTMSDGSEQNGYVSLSYQTSGLSFLSDGGTMTQLNENLPPDGLNKVVVQPPNS